MKVSATFPDNMPRLTFYETSVASDFGNGCEAFRDEYKKIYDKRNCDDFNDGLLPPNPNMHDDEDE
jgi:hypothetical protein